jgi:hypothetical protein
MNKNLHLIQLRNGDWIDPLAVTCLVAGSNAREYRAPDGKTFAAFLRIETRHGSMMCPCNDYAGAVKLRDTLARVCNERQHSTSVKTAEALSIVGPNGVREVPYQPGPIPQGQ